MLDFCENDNNDIEFNGSVIVRGYNMTMDDFLRFAYELRNASGQHQVSAIRTLDDYVMDIEDFIAQEQHGLKNYTVKSADDS